MWPKREHLPLLLGGARKPGHMFRFLELNEATSEAPHRLAKKIFGEVPLKLKRPETGVSQISRRLVPHRNANLQKTSLSSVCVNFTFIHMLQRLRARCAAERLRHIDSMNTTSGYMLEYIRRGKIRRRILTDGIWRRSLRAATLRPETCPSSTGHKHYFGITVDPISYQGGPAPSVAWCTSTAVKVMLSKSIATEGRIPFSVWKSLRLIPHGISGDKYYSNAPGAVFYS